MTSYSPGRLILSGSQPAALNMATDQAMLKAADDHLLGSPNGTGSRSTHDDSFQPTLRFYGWSQPTLSLGYFQAIDDRQQHASSQSVELIRRASGGGAILHHHELTYSLVFDKESRQSTGAEASLYRRVHEAIARAVSHFGLHPVAYARTAASADAKHPSPRPNPDSNAGPPFLCFQRRTDEDLIVSGYKVLGSAQRKGRASVLQHGSLLVSASPLAPELPGLSDLGSKRLHPQELIPAVTEQMGNLLGIRWTPGKLNAVELDLAENIAEKRFSQVSWNEKR